MRRKTERRLTSRSDPQSRVGATKQSRWGGGALRVSSGQGLERPGNRPRAPFGFNKGVDMPHLSMRRAAAALLTPLLAVVLLILPGSAAHAADYKMLLCAGNNGSNSFNTATNTTSSQNPGGIFRFENYCGPAPDPAGNNAFLRIAENQSGGNAGVTAYGSISWTVTPWVAIIGGGGYTRMPGSFNDGWRGRFWAEGWDGSTNNILMQGTGVANGSLGGIGWATTSTFAPHLWPFSGYGDYRRFVFEMTCFRQAGCDRSNWNAVDANTIHLVLADRQDSKVAFSNGSSLMRGTWVRGSQAVTWNASDQGSGLRWERLRIDGATRSTVDHGGACDDSSSSTSGLFARQFQPCPVGGPYGRSFNLDTASVPDGQRTIQVCSQDFAQAAGFNGTGSETCDQRTIRVDNHAPGKPASLEIGSDNPARYLPRVKAKFSLPPDPGSPIRRVHYQIVDGHSGDPLSPKQAIAGTNPTEIPVVNGPEERGYYKLRVWLEDEVGYVGQPADVEIPRDTTPPAAPQDLRITDASTERWAESFGLRWTNVVDAGSPINGAFYQIIDSSGDPVGSAHTAHDLNVEAIRGVQSPEHRGDYAVRVWLKDEEGNIGAAAKIPLPRDTTPPAAPQDVSVTPPDTSRGSDGFDVRWRDLADGGSPIDTAYYRILDREGQEIVSRQTVPGQVPETIKDLETPRGAGAAVLELWLRDAEGNEGSRVKAPLAYSCVRSDAGGGQALTSVLRRDGKPQVVVRQGKGALLRGQLLNGSGGGVANAPLCIFSRVLTRASREFEGIAVTGSDGAYKFGVKPGPSRDLTTVYRPGHREISSSGRVNTRVRPRFKVRKKVVRNKRFARFYGCLPGPDNRNVVVVLQVKRGKGWLAFRRVRSQKNGCFFVPYRFNRVFAPTLFLMRAQVRQQSGYPYRQGTSKRLKLIVLPDRRGGR